MPHRHGMLLLWILVAVLLARRGATALDIVCRNHSTIVLSSPRPPVWSQLLPLPNVTNATGAWNVGCCIHGRVIANSHFQVPSTLRACHR
jgi:hypothetical protein